jgi:hypothetical protein
MNLNTPSTPFPYPKSNLYLSIHEPQGEVAT